MKKIEIIEVSPRDGLQNFPRSLSTSDKLELINRLIGAGVKRIEIASFVNPKRVPQMADAEAVIDGLPRQDGLTRIGLVLNERGLDRALETDIDEIGAVAVASDGFGIRNQKQTAIESAEITARIIERAKLAGRRAQATISVAFGCPFDGEVPVERVVDVAKIVAAAAPLEIAIADTIGVGVPAQVKAVLGAVREAVPDIPLRCHFHNTRNMGIANAWAAVEAGVERLDSSFGGIGGCPFAPKAEGNIATEDLIYLLERSGVSTNLDFEKLMSNVDWFRDVLQLEKLPSLVSRAGGFPAPAAG